MKKIEQMLNKEVANLAVLYVKLHNYHWYVKGPEFLTLHPKFEELYDSVTELYDVIAELLLGLGLSPVANLKNSLDLASISEASGNLSAFEMCKSIADDFKILIVEFKEAIEVADKAGISQVSDVLTPQITELGKQIWILTALTSK